MPENEKSGINEEKRKIWKQYRKVRSLQKCWKNMSWKESEKLEGKEKVFKGRRLEKLRQEICKKFSEKLEKLEFKKKSLTSLNSRIFFEISYKSSRKSFNLGKKTKFIFKI